MIDLNEYLREHQRTALKKLANGKILWGGVGTGKSRVAVAYYLQNEAPKDVYVITTAKKRDSFDWQEEFYTVDIGPKSGPTATPGSQSTRRSSRDSVSGSLYQHGGSESTDSEVCSSTLQHDDTEVGGLEKGSSYPWVVTVDSWNNIAKYADVKGAFFIFDEQRLVGSGDWTRKFLRIAKYNRWILLSGTPGDTWMDYIPVFIANGFYKNRTAFKRDHVVYNNFSKFPKVDRYIGVGKLVRLRSRLLVEMPYVRHTRRRHVEVPLPYDKEALHLVLKERWHVYEDRPLRDVGEMFSVMRRVVNSDPSRLEMVKELWKNHPKLIVFYNFNYELEILRSLSELSHYSNRSIGSLHQTEMHGCGSTTSTTISNDGSSIRNCTSRVSDSIPIGSNHNIPTSSITDGTGRTYSVARPGTIIGSERSKKGSESCLTTLKDTSLKQPIASSSSKPRESTAFPKNNHGSTRSTSLTLPKMKPDGTSRDISSTRAISSPTALSKECPSDSDRTSTKQRMSSRNGGSKDALHAVDHGASKIWLPDTTSTGWHATDASSVSIAEWNGHKHEPIPTTDRWIYLVQYIAGAEAWECIETDAMIMYSRNYSWKITEQAYGRIDRLNTPFKDLWYYDFTSDSMIDRAIGRSLKAKETFNEAKYMKMFESGPVNSAATFDRNDEEAHDWIVR